MRRGIREDLAPAEIMETSVTTTLAQRDAAILVVHKYAKDENEALELLKTLGLDSNPNIMTVGRQCS